MQLCLYDFSVVLSLLVAIVVTSTIYDVTKRNQNQRRHPLLVAFSAFTNFQTLFNLEQNKNDIPCLHGIRGLSIIWIIVGHRYILSMQLPGMNRLDYSTVVSFVSIKSLFPVDKFF